MTKAIASILFFATTLAMAEDTRQTTAPAAPRRLASETDPLVVEPSWWKANQYRYQIGYENAATTSTGILGENVMTGGVWFNESWGLDVYFGFTKGNNANATSVSDATNVQATPNSKVTTTTSSGANAARTLAVGAGLKYRMVQTDWFQFNIGLVAAIFPGGSSSEATGTKAETYADVSNTGNKSVVETNLGSITRENATRFAVGPRLATEFYIKWFPHLAIGFATGILTSFKGDTTVTTDTVSRTYTVTNGVDGTPTAHTTTHTVATTAQEFRGTTFGVGGTTFALTGNFSIRYVW